MKKRSDSRRQQRLEKKKSRKRLKRVWKRVKKRLRLGRIRVLRSRRQQRAMEEATVTIRAPEIFGLTKKDSHATIVRFIERLKNAVVRDERKVCIDFRRTKRLYSDGTLLLLAELESLVRHAPGRLVCTESNTSLVNETLKHLGIFEMLGSTCPVTPKSKDAIEWWVIRGRSADLQAAGPVLERVAQKDLLARELYVGLQEAATNVAHHAYIDVRGDGFALESTSGWWWLFFRIDREKNTLSVAICDLGVGIPRTIAKHLGDGSERIVEGLKTALRYAGLLKPHDGTLIHAAMEAKRTRTGKGERGKGLGQIRQVIAKTNGGGRLHVLSNSGGYRLLVDEHGNESEITIQYSESVFGTVICWQVALT